jgi:hypothetical protein
MMRNQLGALGEQLLILLGTVDWDYVEYTIQLMPSLDKYFSWAIYTIE